MTESNLEKTLEDLQKQLKKGLKEKQELICTAFGEYGKTIDEIKEQLFCSDMEGNLTQHVIDGLGIVYVKQGPFDKGIKALEGKNVPLWTSEEFAKARMLDAKKEGDWRKSDLCMNSFWTAETYNYYYSIEDETDILITSKEFNPLFKDPKRITKKTKEIGEYELSPMRWNALRERAERDPEKAIKSGVLLLPIEDHCANIPFNAFDDYAPTIFHFRTQAKAYGDFLAAILAKKEYTGIKHSLVDINIVRNNMDIRNFGIPLYVDDLATGSELGYYGFTVGDCGCVGGIKYSPARQALLEKEEKKAQKTSLESKIQRALEQGIAFEYRGTMYVPVKKRT